MIREAVIAVSAIGKITDILFAGGTAVFVGSGSIPEP